MESAGRRILGAMLIAVVFCASLDVAFRVLLPGNRLVSSYGATRAHLAAADAPDVQILGDSVSLRGLIGAALAADDSIEVRNDAVESARPAFSYYTLKRQIDAGRAPGAVVIAHTPNGFGARYVPLIAAQFLEWRELPDLYRFTEHQSEAAFGTIARLSYILMNRTSFRRLLMNGDYTFFTLDSRQVHIPNRSEIIIDRYYSNRNDDAANEQVRQPLDLTAAERSVRLVITKDADAYFRRLLALAKENGIPAYWITMPAPRTSWEAYQASGFEAEMLAYLAEFEAGGMLTILQGPFVMYEDALFDDKIHPSPRAAVLFSCEMRKHAPTIAASIRGEIAQQISAADPSHSDRSHGSNAARRMLSRACDDEQSYPGDSSSAVLKL